MSNRPFFGPNDMRWLLEIEPSHYATTSKDSKSITPRSSPGASTG
jgi:hypothetical protein